MSISLDIFGVFNILKHRQINTLLSYSLFKLFTKIFLRRVPLWIMRICHKTRSLSPISQDLFSFRFLCNILRQSLFMRLSLGQVILIKSSLILYHGSYRLTDILASNLNLLLVLMNSLLEFSVIHYFLYLFLLNIMIWSLWLILVET